MALGRGGAEGLRVLSGNGEGSGGRRRGLLGWPGSRKLGSSASRRAPNQEGRMSREFRILAYFVAGLVAARAIVLAIDSIAVGWMRRGLYR